MCTTDSLAELEQEEVARLRSARGVDRLSERRGDRLRERRLGHSPPSPILARASPSRPCPSYSSSLSISVRERFAEAGTLPSRSPSPSPPPRGAAALRRRAGARGPSGRRAACRSGGPAGVAVLRHRLVERHAERSTRGRRRAPPSEPHGGPSITSNTSFCSTNDISTSIWVNSVADPAAGPRRGSGGRWRSTDQADVVGCPARLCSA